MEEKIPEPAKSGPNPSYAISLPGVEKLLTSGQTRVFLVDVRAEEAFLRERIPGSLSVPRGVLEFLIEEVVPDRGPTLIAVCDDGALSSKAAGTLRELGYDSAYALQGGLKEWKQAGHPVVHGKPAAGDAPLSWRWAHGEGSRLIRE